jgi:hypothetical protein
MTLKGLTKKELGEATPNFEVDDGEAEEPTRNPASIPPGYARRPR